MVSIANNFNLDLVYDVFLALQNAVIPTITVKVPEDNVKKWQTEGVDKLMLEVLLGEKTHSTDKEKFKILKRGIIGKTVKKVIAKEEIQFSDLRFNFSCAS